MLKLDNCVCKSERIPWRIIEDEAVLIDVEQGNIVQLNEVAAFIWSEIDGKKSGIKIAECVREEFEADKKTAEKDTLEFLNELLIKRFIEIR